MRIILISLAAAALASSVAGCGSERSPGSSAGKVSVVASFYPLAEAAGRVGGERVTVSNLTPPGVEPHDLELNSDQVERIEDAGVVLLIGGGFQPAVEKAARRAEGRVVDVLAAVRPAPATSDPHVWLDPVVMGEIAGHIESALVAADPDGAENYRSSAREYRRQVEDLDREFKAGLGQCERRLIVTAHQAFGHLASRYQLEEVAIAGVSPDAEPDPRRLAQLTDLVRSRGVTTIFTEELVSPDVAETLAREAGVRTATLNPLESLSRDEIRRGLDYAGVMRQNLAALRSALDCR